MAVKQINERKERAVREALIRDRYRVGTNQGAKLVTKYAGCERDVITGRSVRRLSPVEIEEFKRVMDLKIARRVRTAGARSDVAGVCVEPQAVLAKTPTDQDVDVCMVSIETKGKCQLAVATIGDQAATVEQSASRRASAVSRRACV
jgi:hypothetical protein